MRPTIVRKAITTCGIRFRRKNAVGACPFVWLVTLLLLGMIVTNACSSGMSDDEKEIAVAVALTQTAAAIDASAAEPSTEETPTAAADAEVATVEATVAEAPVEPTATPMAEQSTEAPASVEAVAPTAEASAADSVAESTPLTIESLPITQNSVKIRTLLVAPGEPGALYALLTDEADDTAPATNARFLMSPDFGVTWNAAPSGLPVPEDCLYNINMDYYAPTALFASTCQGIYRWAEATDSWSSVSGEETGMVAVVYGNDNLLWATRFVGADEAPIVLSQNGGQSWQEIAMAHTNGVASIGISPRDSQSGYAIVWPGGEGSNLRRGSIVQEWRLMPAPNGGAAPVNPGMTINGGTGWLYVTTAEADGDRLWISSDPDTPVIEDVSWQEVYRFAPGMHVTLLASGWSSEADKLAIYANVETEIDGQSRFTLIRSLDNGATWHPLVIDAG